MQSYDVNLSLRTELADRFIDWLNLQPDAHDLTPEKIMTMIKALIAVEVSRPERRGNVVESW